MKLIDKYGNEVPQTLKDIHDAIEHTGCVTTDNWHWHAIVTGNEMGIRLTRLGDDAYVVEALRRYVPFAAPTSDGETKRYGNIEEAYMRFRFLVGAFFQVNLPSL